MAQFGRRLGISRYEADEYYHQALQAYHKGKIDTAILALNDALRLIPRNAEYLATRGLVRLEDGQTAEARADFEAALQVFKWEMLAHYGLGKLEYEAGHYESANLHFQAAYQAQQDRPETFYYWALCHHRLNQNDIALRLMQTALQHFPPTDKRRHDAQKWLKEFERLLAKASLPSQNPLL